MAKRPDTFSKSFPSLTGWQRNFGTAHQSQTLQRIACMVLAASVLAWCYAMLRCFNPLTTVLNALALSHDSFGCSNKQLQTWLQQGFVWLQLAVWAWGWRWMWQRSVRHAHQIKYYTLTQQGYFDRFASIIEKTWLPWLWYGALGILILFMLASALFAIQPSTPPSLATATVHFDHAMLLSRSYFTWLPARLLLLALAYFYCNLLLTFYRYRQLQLHRLNDLATFKTHYRAHQQAQVSNPSLSTYVCSKARWKR
ncbi:hypothetical protein LVJ82_05895 [Vitreoscilla massiliensis]|uniref:Uncharacterized protein n=1 Tax=Vitreoscilla massiliensis TaxID=1689272 RepID=A0ABY4E3Z9_9NEIS|nr:hypothetical protein [Vitreoscilla massiliensis]UOO90504.1 hypothetical protein LVJ82_05895 [Vitreoscilla massiliensis]